MPRTLSWSAALRDIRQDRATRPEVREERLKSITGLRGEPAVCLTAWRGRSGRRYVASILSAPAEGVVLGVRRDAAGIASIVTVETVTASEAGAFARISRLMGATEFHVHRLAETSIERAAIVGDLR